eukprot:COSAG02_NODE_14061_length_1315_cov_0.903783_2_plen_53_part_01
MTHAAGILKIKPALMKDRFLDLRPFMNPTPFSVRSRYALMLARFHATATRFRA